MKKDWMITFRSVTFAQKGERLLRRAGIDCVMQRTPKDLSERGCGYCLRLRGADAVVAVQLLKESQLSYGKTYTLTSGIPEERVL